MKKIIFVLSIFLCLNANEKLKKECNKGNAESCYQLGEFYSKKDGAITTKEGQKNQTLTTKYYTKACDLGMKKGCEAMGKRLFAFGALLAQGKIPLAEPTLREGCNKFNNSSACALLGDLFRTGNIVKKNIAEAEVYLKKSCNLDDGLGCVSLAFLYSEDKKDTFTAFEYLKKSCDLNDGTGCAFLGFAYALGKGVVQDTQDALFYFKKSCDLGNGKGCHGVGMTFKFLDDADNAKEFFRRSCELKYQAGCDDYASMNF